MAPTLDTGEKRSRTWRRWLADAVDVLRLMFSRKGVGRPRVDARESSAELLEQQERKLRKLRGEVGRQAIGLKTLKQHHLYTVLIRLDIRPMLSMQGADALRWILSRIEDECHENLVHDHWHPERAGPLQALVMTLQQALERAGERTAWVSVDGKRELRHDIDI